MTTITVAFGVLGEETLVNFFKESFELEYNQQQFIKPTSDFVLNVYLTLIDSFNLNLELNNLPYMQKVVKVAHCVEELLNRCNVFDFKIGDIVQPKRKRTQTFVSQLVGMFLETVDYNTLLLNNQLADDFEINEAIEREPPKIVQLEKEIQLKKRDCDRLKPEMEELNRRNDAMREQGLASHAISQDLEKQGATIKKENTLSNSKLSSRDYEKLNLIAEVNKLEEDLKLVTGDTLEKAENNKSHAADLRKQCVQIQEQSREQTMFKHLKKESVNELRAEQDEINRNGQTLKENLVEKDNFSEKKKACAGEIECLEKKSLELEDEYRKRIEEKENELRAVETSIEPVLERDRLLRRELKKKSELRQKDEVVMQAKEATEKKQQEIAYYSRMKEQVSQQFDRLNENCIAKLKQLNSA